MSKITRSLAFYIGAVRILYKNLYFGRQMNLFIGLAISGPIVSFIACSSLHPLLNYWICFGLSLVSWWTIVPIGMFISNWKNNKGRILRLIQTIPEFYGLNQPK